GSFVAEVKVMAADEKKDLALLKFDYADLQRLGSTKGISFHPLLVLGFRDRFINALPEKNPLKRKMFEFFIFPKLENLKMSELLKNQVGAGINSLEIGETVKPISFSTQRATKSFAAAVYETPAFASSMMGVKNPLSVEFSAIRPGYSGAALYVQIKDDIKTVTQVANRLGENSHSILLGDNGDSTLPKYLIGMITKTELNSNRSLAIPISDILEFIRSNTTEEYLKHPSRGYLFNHGFLQTDLFKSTEQGLYNVSKLSHLKSLRSFSPACLPDFKYTADFEAVAKSTDKNSLQIPKIKSLKKIDSKAIEQLKKFYKPETGPLLDLEIETIERRGGGDIGEGSGPTQLSADMQFKKFFPQGSEDRPTAFGFAYLKSRLRCQTDGLIVTQPGEKQTLTTLAESRGRYYKTTSLSEIWNVLEKDPQAQIDPTLTQHPLCANGFSSRSKKSFYFAKTEILQLPNSEGGYLRAQKVLKESKADIGVGSINCSPDLSQLNVNFNENLAQGWPVKIKFQTDAQKNISGTAEIGSCRIDLDHQTTYSSSIWEHHFGNAALAGKISLDTEGRPVKVSFTNISPTCLGGSVLDLYTIEIWNPGAWK
ncbi:MAG: hypothetical protein AB7O96_14080, partial [Pseudobdellovibrionaceae bacterium]